MEKRKEKKIWVHVANGPDGGYASPYTCTMFGNVGIPNWRSN